MLLPSGDNNGSKKTPMRRQMSEDIATKTAIICRNVPSKFNSTFALRDHFKQYGEVMKVFPNRSKMQATIHFKTHVSWIYLNYLMPHNIYSNGIKIKTKVDLSISIYIIRKTPKKF